ncbi:carbohydrate-binding protein [Streptomyces sp. NPDC058257]|uniref:carbohydrate-binding protein n=1 Tax=Streptomyces sp. NPDC058257 TaxID=3346409 RepID=UPI0036E2A36C
MAPQTAAEGAEGAGDEGDEGDAGDVGDELSSPYGVGSVELRAGAPDGTLLATTPVPDTGGWDTYQATQDVPVEALAGTHKLCLVFKSPQDNSFDVDAVQFTTS